MPEGITIQKDPVLQDSCNYELLREKGLEYIQQLGSKLWTDYNIHDPGITILEALCYAITDLGYRTSFDIENLLAAPAGEIMNNDEQAFFTARNILTVNPWTISDFRRLLIDIDGVKNGWLHCRSCPCNDLYLYANCEKSVLQYEPIDKEKQVIIKGLYDVLVEFEDDETSGNLNSGKVKQHFNFYAGEKLTTATLEMRLPSWQMLQQAGEKYEGIRKAGTAIQEIAVLFISGNKQDDTDIPLNELTNRIKHVLFATFAIVYAPDPADTSITEVLVLEDIPVKVWYKSSERQYITLEKLKETITNSSRAGIIPRYLEKIKVADKVIAATKMQLHAHRNLCEDFCNIQAVEVEDIAVCADMEIDASADREAVLAEVYYLIDQYFSPDIKFYSLQQLLNEGTPVESVFDGPALTNGFIKDEELKSSGLKQFLYVSDIINLLMDIKDASGRNLIKSIRNFTLLRYDKEGKIVAPVEPWQLKVSANQQPRLYIEASKIVIYQGGLPFHPVISELNDTLQVLKGRNAQLKFTVAQNDLPVPEGTYYELNSYFPVQYSLPPTYGVSYAGLPDAATAQRKAQAKQLRAYLMFFEQVLVNYLSQLSHIKDLFAVNDAVSHSYFSRVIEHTEIEGISDIYNGITTDALQQLSETNATFLDRRNRFLDHLLARFAESFNDYALMLYSYANSKAIAETELIKSKIDFIKEYPFMSTNRGRGLNYKDPLLVCNNINIAGLQKRIELLLGLNNTGYLNYFELYEEKDEDGKLYERRWRLVDAGGNIYLSGSTRYTDTDLRKAQEKALKEIASVMNFITNADAYEVKKEKKWVLNLLNAEGEVIATRKQAFPTKTSALAARDEIIAFAEYIKKTEKLFVVEHLLLRPRNTKNLTLFFEIYEEKDEDGVSYERRWRFIDAQRHIYLSGSTRYADSDAAIALEKAKKEIKEVVRLMRRQQSWQIRKKKKWVLNLVDETGEVIATRKEHFNAPYEAEQARNELMQLGNLLYGGSNSVNVDDLLIFADDFPGFVLPQGDPLLPVCLSQNCETCTDKDPYSFRFTVVVNGEDGMAGGDMDFRKFAEQTIRKEAPAHLGLKICWVSKKQLLEFATVYCAWRAEMAKEKPGKLQLHQRLVALLQVFTRLKNVYPPASLHDCAEGNEENRVYLDQTIV